MFKKAVPWVRAFCIVTALLVSQVQAVVASDTSPGLFEDSTGVVTPSDTAASVFRLPPDGRDGCKIFVNTFLLTAPFAGPPIAGQPSYGAPVDLNTDPDTYGGTYTQREAGDVTEWLVVIENATADDGCGPVGAEELTQVQAELRFSDSVTGTLSTQAVTLSTTTLTNDGDLAWGTVTFTVPNNMTGYLRIRTTAATEAVNNKQNGGLYPDPNDVVDFDDDRITMVGPGFTVVSFTPYPAQAGPGELVDFTITILNTRPGVDITGISVASDYAPFGVICTDNPFTGKWITGEDPVFTLAPLAQAQCTVTGVPIPNDPPPDAYSLVGDITAYDAGGLDVTVHAVSTPVDIELPSVAIAKHIAQIRRGGTTITPPDPAAPGDIITYQIVVTNDGEVTLQDLWIVDSLTGPIYLSPGLTLPPDAGSNTLTVTTTHIVQQNSPDPLVNKVTVTARGEGYTQTVSADASASYDIQDSALKVDLTVIDPDTGNPVFEVNPDDVVRYRLALRNEGSTVITNLTYVTLPLPLRTVGTPPAIIPDTLPVPTGPGDQLVFTWDYTVLATDPDPLVSTIRVRGTAEGGMLIYGQDQASLDLANTAIGIQALVIDPESDTVLRGATVVYEVTATNKGSNPICDVKVKQIRRDPDTGLETTLVAELPFTWPGTPGQLAGGASVTTYATYLVTSEDKDPLDMIFEVTAVDACPTGNPLSDRTTRVLDVSDAQVNAELIANVGADGVAEVGDAIVFTFIAENVGAVTLDNLTATYCIYRGVEPTTYCDLGFDPDKPLTPTVIGSFDETTGGFTYTILAADAEAAPFVAEVTMQGTDNKGNVVSIKAATTVSIATDKIIFELSGPETAVIGDIIPFGYAITNDSGVTLTNVQVYNMLEADPGEPYGYQLVGTCPDIPPDVGSNVCSGSFDYRVKPNQGITGDVLTMVGRVLADSSIGPLLANDTATVMLIPILTLEKTGDTSVVPGEDVHYTITFTNNSSSQNVDITGYTDAVFDQYEVTYEDGSFNPWPDDPDLGAGSAQVGILPWGTSVTGNFTLLDVDPIPSPLVNVFTVNGTREYDGASVSASDDHSVTLACPIMFSFVVTNLEPPGDQDDILGEWLEWRISFTNISAATINNIVINETLNWAADVPASQISWPSGVQGRLNPGESGALPPFQEQIVSDYYIGDPDVMPDFLIAEFSESGGVSRCEMGYAYPLYSPIGIIKFPDPLIAFTGETVTYDILVGNLAEEDDAPYDRYYVTTSDSLLEPKPMPMPYDGPTAPETTSGWLEPEEIIEKLVGRVVLASDPDELINVITAEFPDPMDESVRLFTWFEALVFTGDPLSVTKTPSSAVAVPGTRITYDYTVTNASPYPITDITLVDDLIGDLAPGMTGGTINLDPGMSFTSLVDVPYDIKLTDPDPLVNNVLATGIIHLPDDVTGEVTATAKASVDLEDTDIQITKTAKQVDNEGNPGADLEDNFPASGPDGVPEVLTGTPIFYCFTIENQNTNPDMYIDNIVLQDALFPGALQTPFQQAVMDQLGHSSEQSDLLRGGETVSFCYGPTVVSQAMGDPLTNLAYINGVSSSGVSIYADDEFEIDLRGLNLLITKLPSQPLAFVGEDLIYTIMIQNTNASRNIHISEVTDAFEGGAAFPLPLDQFDWTQSGVDDTPVGILGPGGIAVLNLPYTVRNTDPDPLRNVATVTGKVNESPLPESEWTLVEDSTRATVAITASQLLVRKTASPTIANPSENQCGQTGRPQCSMVRYTITITNVGTTEVKGIMAVDHHFDEATGAYVDVVYDEVAPGELTRTELSPSQSAFISYELPMPTREQLAAHPELDPYVNTITVYGVVFDETGQPILLPNPDPDDPWDDDKTIKTSVQESVDILQPYVRIVKSPVTLAAAPGQNVIYNITITSAGDQTLDHLLFTDVTESQTVNLDAVCPNDDPAVCPFVYGAEPSDAPNPNAGEPYDEALGLAPRQVLRGTIVVQVPEDWTENEFLNVAEIRGQSQSDGSAVQDRSSASIDIRSEGIQVEKFASVPAAPVGTPVTYTVRITNIGTNALDRLVIADLAIDSEPTHVVTVEDGFPDSPEEDIPGNDAGTLDPGEMYVLTYIHTLTALDPDPYINRVTVAGYTSSTSVLNVAEAAVDIQGATIGVEKFVCVGLDEPPTGDGLAETLLDPCLDVVNIGDANPDEVTYYLHLYNPGQTIVQNLVVTDSLTTVPPITWPLPAVNGLDINDGLPGGNDELWIMYPYTVQPGAPDPLVNLVTVNGQAPNGSPVNATASASLTLVSGDLMLTKSAVTQAIRGQDVIYTLTVENLSESTDITAVQVIDPLSPSGGEPIVACSVATLIPGATHDCSFTHTIALSDASPLVNTATATGTQNSVTVSDTASHTVEIVTPGVAITKTASTNVAAIGDTVTYTYVVTNTGSVGINEMVVTDSNHPASEFVPSAFPAYLAPGASETRTWTHVISAQDPDPYTNTMTLTGRVNGQPVRAEATETVVIANGALAVSAVPNRTFVLDGETVTFAYIVTNLDPDDAVTDLALSDNLCGAAALMGQLGSPTLAVGASVTVYCTVTAALPGPVVATFYAEGQTPEGAVFDTATAEVPVTSGGLVVTKTADRTTVLTTPPDNVITYTITFTNVETETLNNIVVNDPLVVSLSPAPPATLAAGQSHTMTGTYTVNPASPPSSVSNTVTVTATGVTTGETYSDSDSASVAVLEDPNATLALTKEASVQQGRPGDPVTYTFTVRNVSGSGAVATGITVSDPALAATDPPSGIVDIPDLAAGNAYTFTRAVQIPPTWVQTTFTNTAQVLSDSTLQDEASATVLVELLAFNKTAAPDPVALGDELQYTFTVTSYSDGTIPNVTISDPAVTAWDQALPASIPPAGATASGHLMIPTDYANDTYTNTAQLLVGTEVVATASATVDVTRLGLDVTIDQIVQPVGVAPDVTLLQLIQTGEPVRVTLTLRNTGATAITSPAYTATVNIGSPAQVCTPAEALPASLAAGASVTTTCTFTPTIGLAEYKLSGLTRTVTVNATGTSSSTPVTDQAAADFTMVDLQLLVELAATPVVAGATKPGDNVTFTIRLINAGASPLGCPTSADPSGQNLDCHFQVTLEDSLAGADASLAALITTLQSAIYNLVIPAGAYGAVNPSTTLTTGQYALPTVTPDQNPVIYTAVAEAGYYSASLAPNLLTNYIVHGEDTAEVSIQSPVIDVTVVANPNPPLYNQNVTYTVTVTNTGTVDVTSLTATYSFAAAASGIMLVSHDSRPAQQTGTIALNSTTLTPGQTTTGILSKIEDRTARYTFSVTVVGTGVSQTGTATDSDAVTLTPDLSAMPTATSTTGVGAGTATLDPNAIDPIVTKTASVTQGMPGDPVVWTISVYNGGTAVMSNVTIQDNVPELLTLGTSATSRGTLVAAGQVITVTTGAVNPGETVTVTVNTAISSAAVAPATITNTACAARDGGTQKCATGTVSLGPGATTLPATGIRSSSSSLPGFPAGLVLFAALMILMSVQVSRRRAWIAFLFVAISLAIVAGAVVALVMNGDDEDQEKPAPQAQGAATETPAGAAIPGTALTPEPAVTEAIEPVSTTGPGALVMQFPPTPTPYVAPTPSDVRYLMIPKLGEQFAVPIPIVELPLVDRQWDVSGLGYYVGWLQGTTWLDPHWGNTVLAAHVQLGFDNPGPFWGLGELQPGDEIIITEGDQKRHFKVMSTEKVDPNDVSVTAPTSGPTLTLITCTEWDNHYGVFSQRMVVRAVPFGQS